MLISDFDYDLPDELIAQYPAADRRGSRLLELGNVISDRAFSEFPTLLQAGDLLVFNDTRVIKARLAAIKASGGRVEILIERVQSDRAVLAHIKASKSPKPGGQLLILEFSHLTITALKPLYDFYSFNVLPMMGQVVAKDADSYRYLAESIRMHPDQETLKQMMIDAGLERCRYNNLSGGIAALHRGYTL